MATKEQLEAALERARRAQTEGVPLAELDRPALAQHETPLPPKRQRVVEFRASPRGRPMNPAAAAAQEIRNNRRRLSVTLGELLKKCETCGQLHGKRCPEAHA